MYCYFGGLQIEPTLVTLAWLLLLAFRLESGHCGTQYFHFHLVGNTKLNGIALNAHDRAEQPAVRDNLVPILERAQHFLGFLLASLPREIKKPEKIPQIVKKRGEAIKPLGPVPCAIIDKAACDD